MSLIPVRYCKHGHSMLERDNVYITPRGERRCRTCLNRPARKPPKRRFQQWAEDVWNAASEHDRMLLRHFAQADHLELP